MPNYDTYVTLLHSNNTKNVIKLEKGGMIKLFKDTLNHDDIVSSGLEKYLRTDTGNMIFITQTTLEEYINYTLKISQPIYFKDASTIISMLNIKKNKPTGINFLEVGTGSGALTMYLSDTLFTFGRLHTYDTNNKFLKLAETNYKNWISSTNMPDNVIFYNDDVLKLLVPDYFYDGMVIDAPRTEMLLIALYKKTKYGSPIIIFSPNISVIVDIITMIYNNKLPLKKIQITRTFNELWDVRVKENTTIAKPFTSNNQTYHTGYILHLIHFDTLEPVQREDHVYTLNNITCMGDFEDMIFAQKSLV